MRWSMPDGRWSLFRWSIGMRLGNARPADLRTTRMYWDDPPSERLPSGRRQSDLTGRFRPVNLADHERSRSDQGRSRTGASRPQAGRDCRAGGYQYRDSRWPRGRCRRGAPGAARVEALAEKLEARPNRALSPLFSVAEVSRIATRDIVEHLLVRRLLLRPIVRQSFLLSPLLERWEVRHAR